MIKTICIEPKEVQYGEVISLILLAGRFFVFSYRNWITFFVQKLINFEKH